MFNVTNICNLTFAQAVYIVSRTNGGLFVVYWKYLRANRINRKFEKHFNLETNQMHIVPI